MAKCAQCGADGADAKGVCSGCRLRAFGQARRIYHFTDELRDALRRAYVLPKMQRSAAISALERRTGWPRHAFKCEAIRLGIVTHGQRRPWTAAEDSYLANRIGVVSTKQIARKLRRSVPSVTARAEKLKLSVRVREGYNVADLCSVFGVHYTTARSWLRRGLFGEVHEVAGLRVTETNVVRFIRQYPAEYDLRRVDQDWYKAMVFGHLAEYGERV